MRACLIYTHGCFPAVWCTALMTNEGEQDGESMGGLIRHWQLGVLIISSFRFLGAGVG